MSFYERRILPRFLDLVMRSPQVTTWRERVIPEAAGVVVELGIGSGLNLPLYGPGVRALVGVDPSAELLALAAPKTAGLAFPVELRRESAERLSLDPASADTVVVTWALCSIPDPVAALREARRVLRPGGRLLFVEHGLSRDAGVERWQRRLTPVWRRIAGGCHLDRPIARIVEDAGFAIASLENAYAPGPRPWTCLYRGVAEPLGRLP